MTVADSSPVSTTRELLTSHREEIIENQYEMERLESWYRKLYDCSPQMQRTINLDGVIIDCNQAYVNNLGYSKNEEVIGHSIYEHVATDNADAMRESFEEWRRNGKVRNKEVRLRRKDGSTFSVLINANNLYDDEGNLAGSNTVLVDITEILMARDLLEKSNRELKREEQLKNEFIAIASHELRTPIQPLLGYALLAKRGLVSQDSAWDGILKQARRLQKLANDILDVSRIETGNLSYDMKYVYVSDIVEEIVNYAHFGVHDIDDVRPVDVVTRLGEDVELCVDKTRIIQALTNILSNSIKFTAGGQILIETCILAEQNIIEIKIRDSGIGINPEMLPNLFGKFVTNSSGAHLDKHGTGLGLFITRSIVQAHGGDVFAHNNKDGNGATFTMRLPVKQQQVCNIVS